MLRVKAKLGAILETEMRPRRASYVALIERPGNDGRASTRFDFTNRSGARKFFHPRDPASIRNREANGLLVVVVVEPRSRFSERFVKIDASLPSTLSSLYSFFLSLARVNRDTRKDASLHDAR